MKLLNRNQIKNMSKSQREEYKMNLLMDIEDSILTQVFGDDDYLYEDDFITEADLD